MPKTICILSPRHRAALPLLVSAVSAVAVLAAASSAVAGSVYRCETNTGVVEYSNNKPEQFDSDQCQKINLPELTTIQAPKSAKAPAARPAPGAATSAAESFPSVSSANQQRRDKARRQILRQELKREQTRLAELQGEFKDGEPDRRGDERNYQKYLDRVERLRTDINRRESSISAIRKEIGAPN